MTEFSRSLLAAAREGLAPDPEVAARVRAKVAAAVAVGTAAATGSHAVAATTAPAPASPPAGATAATPGSGAPTAAAGSSSLLLKLGAALLVLGMSAAIVVVARDTDPAPEVPQLSVPAVDVDDVSTRVRVAAPNDPLVLPDKPPARARPAAQSSSVPPVAAPAQEAMPATERVAATLSREVELIDLAMVSLRKHAPRAAIEAIRVFERETFGKGQMAEEAAAIEIEAHCTLREDVTAALADFDRTWPESAQRERIQTTCFAGK